MNQLRLSIYLNISTIEFLSLDAHLLEINFLTNLSIYYIFVTKYVYIASHLDIIF